MKYLTLFLCLTALTFTGCASKQVNPFGAGSALEVYEPSDPIAQEPYRLHIGDQIEVVIESDNVSTRTVIVREDGTISIPGGSKTERVMAKGKTLLELEGLIQGKAAVPQTQLSIPEDSLPKELQKQVSPGEVAEQKYFLRKGDQVEISVWKHNNLNRVVQIREDGSFAFPLIGDIQAENRSVREVEKEVQERLNADYLVNPEVTAQITGAKFTILGAVQSPGFYNTTGGVDLLSALSQAGGIISSGSNNIELRRKRENQILVVSIDLSQVLKGEAPNLPILPNDSVYVLPKVDSSTLQISVRLVDAEFTVVGEASRPGSFKIPGQTNLIAAISKAGGINKFGSERIEIFRRVQGKSIMIKANFGRVIRGLEENVTIHPRDTLYIRRRLI